MHLPFVLLSRMLYTALQIASYFLAGPGSKHPFGTPTHMKMQKLVYYTKVWSIVDGEDVVSDRVCKWKHGPVIPNLYDALKANGRAPISTFEYQPVTLDDRTARIADIVMYSYGRLGAFELSDLTHAEDPWRLTDLNAEISTDMIRAYYAAQPFAQNFPLDGDKPFHPILTQSAYAFAFDMSDASKASLRAYPSFDEYRRIVDLACATRVSIA